MKLQLTALALSVLCGVSHAQLALQKRVPANSIAVLINEFMPDPEGMDAWGKEYVEFTNTSKAAVSLQGWNLKDADGNVIYTFGDTVLPARNSIEDQNYYLVVVFGPDVPSALDDSFQDGDFRAVIFAGAADQLANNSGALILEDASGSIVDAVIYGSSDPSGAGVDAAVTQGHWVGRRVDTAFAAGEIPILEGGVLGRDFASNDYHNARDWRAHGGKNSFGPTFGRRNNSEAFGGINDLIALVQTELNNIIGVFSLYNGGYVDILNASHGNDVISDPDLEGGFSVTSTHTFLLEDEEAGHQELLSGTLTISYERKTGSTFEVSVLGALSGSRHELAISFTHVYEGFGTLSLQTTATYSATWTKDGVPYQYDNVATSVTAWSGPSTLKTTDHRDWTDWSGNLKHSDAVSTISLAGDGARHVTFALVRSFPFKAPAFGQSQSMYEAVALSELEYTEANGAQGLTSKAFARWDHSFGYGFNQADPFSLSSTQLQISLQSAAVGGLVESRVAGDPWDEIGSFTTVGTYPIAYLDSSGSPTSTCTFFTEANHTIADVTSPDGVQKRLILGGIVARCDDWILAEYDYAIDPIDGCGCGCGGSGCTCGGGKKERTGATKWILRGATALSWGACAMGAVGSGGLGAFFAGALSYGAGELWDEIVPLQ